MVITSSTRNRVAFTGTWVRIPPSPFLVFYHKGVIGSMSKGLKIAIILAALSLVAGFVAVFIIANNFFMGKY